MKFKDTVKNFHSKRKLITICSHILPVHVYLQSSTLNLKGCRKKRMDFPVINDIVSATTPSILSVAQIPVVAPL